MKGICSSPEDSNSLPNTINQLADILGNLFDDIALPELPQIDSGEFSLPEDAPFDFPTGGGDMPFFDPLGGLEGGFPGGGEEFGPGGEDGGGGGVDNFCIDAFEKHVTFLAKTAEEIPAAENGNPGIGKVKELVVVFADPEQLEECIKKCHENYRLDLKNAKENLKDARENSVFDPITVWDEDEKEFKKVNTRDTAVKHWVKRLSELNGERLDCIKKCNREPDDDGPKETENQFLAQNISCDKIEKDTTVVVSGTITSPLECGDYDLYVMVEACGCCDE
jgi:hypothetical protein